MIKPATGTPLKWEGVANNGKLLERANQFAANVGPLPNYSVRLTDEVSGKVFLLVSILEGDAPPYLANTDPTVWLRTGNISTPLRQANRDELVRMVEKKNLAEAVRRQNLQTAKEVFKAGLARAEAEGRQAIAVEEQASDETVLSASLRRADNTFLTISLQPFYPKRLLVEPWEIMAALSELTTRSRYGMEMPPLNMEPMPNGLFSFRATSYGERIRCCQLYGNGFISYTEAASVKDQSGQKVINLTSIALAFYRHLVFSRKFYARFNYNGVIVGEIELSNAIGASVHEIVPEGYRYWPEARLIDKLSNYSWPLELDTHALSENGSVDDYFKETMRKIYWDLGIPSVNFQLLDKHLEEVAWQ